MHVTLHAGTVTASATANTISGLLLPYGEIGHTLQDSVFHRFNSSFCL